MRKTAHVERRFENEHRILDKLAKLLPVGQPQSGLSYPALAEKMGEQPHAVLLAKRTMEDAGILRIDIEYPKGKSGRVSVWELTMPVDQAHEEMRLEHQRQLERPSRKRVRQLARRGTAERNGHLPGVRIPLKDEAWDFVRSARTYVGRIEWARQHLADMRAMGIEVDESSVVVQRDERLENIALVLPVIDELERERDRALDQARRWQPA